MSGVGDGAASGGERASRQGDIWRAFRLNTGLLKAALRSDTAAVNSLLAEGADPLCRCRSSLVSASHLAALLGLEDVLGELIRRGGRAAVEARDSAGRQPHHLAAAAGQLAALRLILQADPGLVDSQVSSADSRDVGEEQLDSFLHDHAEVDRLMPNITEGSSALLIASRRTYLELVKYLIEELGADVNLQDSEGHSAFDVVGAPHCSEVPRPTGEQVTNIQCLKGDETPSLEMGTANPQRGKALIDYFRTLVPESTKYLSVQSIHNLVKSAFEHNSIEELDESMKWFKDNDRIRDLKLPNNIGQTLIHTAIQLCYKDGLTMVLKYCPSLANTFGKDGKSPLHLAIENDWTEGVEILLGYSTLDVHLPEGKETVLHTAASRSNPAIMRMLLLADTKHMMSMKDTDGYIPIFRMVQNTDIPVGDENTYGRASESRLLLECFNILKDNSDLRVQGNDGNTLIHIAVIYSRTNVLQALKYDITLGSKCPNDKGFYPIHLAVLNETTECLDFLLDFYDPEDISSRTNDTAEETVLHIAAKTGNEDAAESILKRKKCGHLVCSVNRRQWQPLILAALGGYRDIVLLLLEHGADLAARCKWSNYEKDTALDIISFNIPNAVAMMNDFLDDFIDRVSQQEKEDSFYFQISLNFKLFLITESAERPKSVSYSNYGSTQSVTIDENEILKDDCKVLGRKQMRVISAITKCKHEAMRQTLLLHPLTESFIMEKWKHLRKIYYIAFMIFMMHVMAILGLALTSYNHLVFIIINLVLPIITFCVELLILKSLSEPRAYFLDPEAWLKLSVIVSSSLVSWLALADVHPQWLRSLTSLAVLLSFTQTLFLVGKSPGPGLWIFMLWEVAYRVLQVLLVYLLLMLGFTFAFLILFDGQYPFKNPWAAVTKVMVMMVELDYGGVFGADEGTIWTPVGLMGRILYLVFVVAVVMSVTNLMFGISVSNVGQLVREGRSLFLGKTATFLVLLEEVVSSLGLLRWFMLKEATAKVWPNVRKNVVEMQRFDGKVDCEDNSLPWSIKRALLRRIVKDLHDDSQSDSISL